MQFARNPACRRCGHSRPSDVTAAMNADAPKLVCAGDWACPLCSKVNFGNRRTCEKCNAPKPEGGKTQQAAISLMQAMPQSALTGGVVGFVAPGSLQPVSSWSRQWDSGPANGMLVGETDLPAWMSQAQEDDDDIKNIKQFEERAARARLKKQENGDASSDGSRKKKNKKKSKKAKKKAKKAAQAKGEAVDSDEDSSSLSSDSSDLSGDAAPAAKKPKGKAKAKAKTKGKKVLDVDEELALRAAQRARRKSRIIEIALD